MWSGHTSKAHGPIDSNLHSDSNGKNRKKLVIATRANFAKKTFDEKRGISIRMTTTQKKINLVSVTAQELFKTVTQETNEIKVTMIKDFSKEK
jgi:hypothetical protein